MTLATRQTFAAARISSIVAFFVRRHSSRGSIATYMPILVRNLKQSATVFEGLKTRINQMEHARVDRGPCRHVLLDWPTPTSQKLSRSLVRERGQDLRSCATHLVEALR